MTSAAWEATTSSGATAVPAPLHVWRDEPSFPWSKALVFEQVFE